ncbi:MAG: hypothetical protein WA463_09230 [Terriglobales bacterium]
MAERPEDYTIAGPLFGRFRDRMPHMARALPALEKSARKARPYCFVCYSSREPHIDLLIECLRIVFTKHFDLRLAPSDLESGSSQRAEIMNLIRNCAFAVVAIDGLRPNVVFEFGALHAHGKPVIFIKEQNAEVDIRNYYRDPAGLVINPVSIDLDHQLSDAKDLNYAIWNRFSVQATVKTVWSEYLKKRHDISSFVDIPEPELW